MTYLPEASDYRIKCEQLAPAVFTFHLWQFIDAEWRFLFEVPQVIVLDKLKEHSKLHSEDGVMITGADARSVCEGRC